MGKVGMIHLPTFGIIFLYIHVHDYLRFLPNNLKSIIPFLISFRV